MPWVPIGLREGIVTSRYPKRPDGYAQPWAGSIAVEQHQADPGLEVVAARCPTAAISVIDGQARLDRGRCILCGRCADERPDVFRPSSSFAVARSLRPLLVVPERNEIEEQLPSVRAALAARVRRLRRSVHLRHIDCGSDGTEEWEIAALLNPVYDIHRLGLFFTASPRHADLLLVTGAGSEAMREPLQLTFASMPDPKVVIAVGTDAISGGVLAGSYATSSGICDQVPVDVLVPGSPPSPFSVLDAILLALGRVPERDRPER